MTAGNRGSIRGATSCNCNWTASTPTATRVAAVAAKAARLGPRISGTGAADRRRSAFSRERSRELNSLDGTTGSRLRAAINDLRTRASCSAHDRQLSRCSSIAWCSTPGRVSSTKATWLFLKARQSIKGNRLGAPRYPHPKRRFRQTQSFLVRQVTGPSLARRGSLLEMRLDQSGEGVSRPI